MANGYLLRQDQRMADRAERPCSVCTHPTREHREDQPTIFAVESGVIVERPNPDYQPNRFRCRVSGCSCVVQAATY